MTDRAAIIEALRAADIFIEHAIYSWTSDQHKAKFIRETIAEALSSARPAHIDQRAQIIEEAARWHDQRRRETPDAFEMEFHEASAKAVRALAAVPPPSILERLRGMSEDERMSVFSEFCLHCGSDDPTCQCCNDE